jgi:hypothetical protein
VNAPLSRRFAKFQDDRNARQRLDCGAFTAALGRRHRRGNEASRIECPREGGKVFFRALRAGRG